MKKRISKIFKKICAALLSAGIIWSATLSSFAAINLPHQSGVMVDKEWTVEFSGDVDFGSVSENVVMLDQTGNEIRTELYVNGSKVFVKPVDAVGYAQEYSIAVKPGVKSSEGRVLSEDVKKSFTTVSYEDAKIDMVTASSEPVSDDIQASVNAVQHGAYNAALTYQKAALLTAKVLDADPEKVSYETWNEAVNSALGIWNNVEKQSAELEASCDSLVQNSQSLQPSANRAIASAYDKDEITAVFDAAPAGKKIKTLANHLGVDARRAFAMLKMSQEELKAEAWNDAADTIETLENTATVIKDGSKVALFVGGAIITGGVASGGMSVSQAGAAITSMGKAGLAQIVREGGAALVTSGVDLMLEVSSDSAAIAFGSDNGFTAMATEARSVTAPVAGIIGFYNIKGTSSASDWVCNSFMVADTEREAFQEGKLFGIQVTDEPVFGGELDPGINPPKKIEVLKIEDTVKDNVKKGLENWIEEKTGSPSTVDEITDEPELEILDGETFEQLDTEPEEDKGEDKTDNAASFSSSVSGTAPNYNVSVNSANMPEGAIVSISIVSGQGLISGKTSQIVNSGNTISWGFGIFANTGPATLKVKRADTDEYQFISIPEYAEDQGEKDYENEMGLDYSRLVDKEFVDSMGCLNVMKCYSDDEYNRAQGRYEVYFDSSKSQIKEKSYRMDGYMTGPYKAWFENGQVLSEGSYEAGVDELGYYYSSKDGQWLSYASDGTLVKEQNYIVGYLDGVQLSYTASGMLKLEENYNFGQREGEYKRFDEQTGNLVAQGSYSNGERDGAWTDYSRYPGGTASRKVVTEYRNGQRVSYTDTYYSLEGAVSSIEEGAFQNDLKQGEWKYTGYSAQGWLSTTTVSLYQEGICTSSVTTNYDEDGNIISQEIYEI